MRDKALHLNDTNTSYCGPAAVAKSPGYPADPVDGEVWHPTSPQECEESSRTLHCTPKAIHTQSEGVGNRERVRVCVFVRQGSLSLR